MCTAARPRHLYSVPHHGSHASGGLSSFVVSEADDGHYYDLLTDFRHGGFRMLGDLVCDVDDLATARERKQLRRPADSPAFQKMMEAYLSAPFSGNERAVVSKVCRKLLNKIIRPSLAAPYVVAIGKRNLLWDLLPDRIEEHVLEVDHAE